MKKYIITIMVCFMTINSSLTIFAQQDNNMKIQKKVLQQQKEENITQYYISGKKQKNIAPEDYIPVLMYHHFESEGVEAGNGVVVGINEFEDHIKTLQQAGYTPIFLSDLYHIMKQAKQSGKQSEMKLDKKYVVITMDDGYKSNYELAYPILQKYNMKASISVITAMMDEDFVLEAWETKKMNWDNLNEMQNSGLVEVYNHTYDHEPVGDRIYADVYCSVKRGEEMLDKNLQKRSDVKVLVYPNGNYRKDVALSIQHDLGYNLQLTTKFDVVNRNTNMLEIPRITVDSGYTGEQLLQLINQAAKHTF